MDECKPLRDGPRRGATVPVVQRQRPLLRGRAVQLDPIKPKWKQPVIKRLKLNCDKLLSTFAFEFNMRRYIVDHSPDGRAVQVDPIKPTLKAPGSKRLILEYDELVTNVGFYFNLSRFRMGARPRGRRRTRRGSRHTWCRRRRRAAAIGRRRRGQWGRRRRRRLGRRRGGRGLHSFALELSLSNSRTHS